MKIYNNFGIIYETSIGGTLNTKPQDVELVGNHLEHKKIVKFNAKVEILEILKDSKGKNLYVYEFNFDKPYNFMYVTDTCGNESELDDLANEYNRKNLNTEIIERYGKKCEVFIVRKSNKFKIAAHEGSGGSMYISTESTDIPGIDEKEYHGVEDAYQWKFIK